MDFQYADKLILLFLFCKNFLFLLPLQRIYFPIYDRDTQFKILHGLLQRGSVQSRHQGVPQGNTDQIRQCNSNEPHGQDADHHLNLASPAERIVFGRVKASADHHTADAVVSDHDHCHPVSAIGKVICSGEQWCCCQKQEIQNPKECIGSCDQLLCIASRLLIISPPDTLANHGCLASPIADPGIKQAVPRSLHRHCCIDAVPNPAIMLWVSTFRSGTYCFPTPAEHRWKRSFQHSLSHPTRNHFVQWISYFPDAAVQESQHWQMLWKSEWKCHPATPCQSRKQKQHFR